MKVKFYKELQSILKQSRFDSLYTWQNNRQDELDKVDPKNLRENYQLLADQQLVFLDIKQLSPKETNRLKTTLLSLSDIILNLKGEIEDNYLCQTEEDAGKYCKLLFKLLQKEVDGCFDILQETTWCRQRNYIDEFGWLGSAYDISLTESIEEVADIDLFHLRRYPDTQLPTDSLELYAWYTAAVYLLLDNAQYTQRELLKTIHSTEDNKPQDYKEEQELSGNNLLTNTEQPYNQTSANQGLATTISFVEENLEFLKGEYKYGIPFISDSDFRQLVLLTQTLFSTWNVPDEIFIKIHPATTKLLKAYNKMLFLAEYHPTKEQRKAVVIFLLKLLKQFEPWHLEGNNYRNTTIYKKIGMEEM